MVAQGGWAVSYERGTPGGGGGGAEESAWGGDAPWYCGLFPERGFFVDNLLVQTHFIIVIIRLTGIAP